MSSPTPNRTINSHIAVLSGDLIDSRRLPTSELEEAFTALKNAALEISFWQWDEAQDRAVATCFTRNRGDGWQIYLAKPRLALRAALYMRAALLAEGATLRTRIAIAEGEGDLGLGNDLNNAGGPAFVASGRALDNMKSPVSLTHATGGALGACVRLVDHISGGWTQAQARAVRGMLPPRKPTRSEVAASLAISRQAVEQSLNAAGFGALADAMALIEITAHDAS